MTDISILVLAFFINNIFFSGGQVITDICKHEETCKDCIRRPGCVWCAVPVTKNDRSDVVVPKHRCKIASEIEPSWCDSKYVQNPHSTGQILNSRQLGIDDATKTTVQITPQYVEINIRIGETYKLQFNYGVVEDYPVDLYYLMDLSKSMHDDKMRLSKLGNDLADAMKRITKNFRIGFGSFVDKVALPFVSTVPSKLEQPCTISKTEPCVKAYSFKNHMSLDDNTEKFSKNVADAPVSGNLDNPEGGFDALMQAMVCIDEIGWREKARHLLVYSSDASFHIAGDGKLAGVVEPHDGHCYMDNHTYTHGLVFDYPSIGQITEKARENNIFIIFAVSSDRIEVYKDLSEMIRDSSYGVLSDNSSEVIKLITDQYDKLLESVAITDNSSKYIEVKYFTNCLDKSKPVIEGSTCEGLKYESNKSNVTFWANINAKQCPEDKSQWTQFLEIKPTALNESLIVKVNLNCDCNCSKETMTSESRTVDQRCSDGGKLECGVCVCDNLHSGKFCECDKNSNLSLDNSECMSDTTPGIICSGAGTCECGVCKCDQRPDPFEVISGIFCECSNYTCKRGENRKLCSGKDHGNCVCGICQCLSGWEGDKCECSSRMDTCIPKGGGPVCSGRGICKCGECLCNSTNFEGQFCELCPICPGGACNKLRSCVECLAYSSGNLAKEGCDDCNSDIDLILKDKVLEDTNLGEENKGFCRFPDENDCTFSFTYKKFKEEQKYEVVSEKKKRCTEVNVLGVVLGVIGSIVLIGLLTLIIWKVVTSIHDQREYSKFEKERSLAKFSRDDNPLYIQATSRYENPAFGR